MSFGPESMRSYEAPVVEQLAELKYEQDLLDGKLDDSPTIPANGEKVGPTPAQRLETSEVDGSPKANGPEVYQAGLEQRTIEVQKELGKHEDWLPGTENPKYATEASSSLEGGMGLNT